MKKINVLAVIAILVASSFMVGMSPAVATVPESQAATDTLLYGTTSFGYDIDPHNAWDSASSDIIDQVSEGLFAYQLRDPKLRIVPRLASACGTWDTTFKEFTVKLREGVTFHNGVKFNATTAAYSLNRVNNLCDLDLVQIEELYAPIDIDEDGTMDLVMNETVVVDEYTIKIKLNYVYLVFEALLCFSASNMVEESSAPDDYVLQPGVDTLIGTGPYEYISQDADFVKFEAYADYYRGTPAVPKITFVKYKTSVAISTAMLAGDLDAGSWNPDFLQDFIDSPDISVGEPTSTASTGYLGFNNIIINKTMRQAMSYAIDYEYAIDQIYNNLAIRMNSPVPYGILWHKDCDVATLNVTHARKILIDAGLSKGLDENSPDEDWIEMSKKDPIGYYNYTYNLGNIVREDLGVLLRDNFGKIGVYIWFAPVTWTQYLYKLYFYPYELETYYIGWIPDYNDPSNFINPLFSPTSMSNGAQVNDSKLNTDMAAALQISDTELRKQAYFDIQDYISEDLMPWAFFTYGYGRGASSVNIVNPTRNAMGKMYVFSWSWWGVNTTVTDPYAELWCNEGGEPYVKPDEETTRQGIPGYSVLVMLGVAALSVLLIIKKRK